MNNFVLMAQSTSKNGISPLTWNRLLFWLVLATFLTIFQTGPLSAQRNLNLYHMNNVIQSYQVNPAFIPDAKLYVGIPLLSAPNISLSNRGLNFKEIGFGKPLLSFSGRVDYNQALLNSDALNYVGGDASIELFNVGYRVKDQFFSISLTDYLETDIRFPASILALGADFQGNLLSFGKFYDLSGFEVDLNHYRALALGYAREFGDRISFGVKVKLLGGLANIRTTNNALGFVVRNEGSNADFVNNMDILTSGMDVWAGNSNLGVWKDGNFGFAIDAGGRFQVNDKLEISASVVNLGYIKWNHFLSRTNISHVAVDTSNTTTFFDDFIDDEVEKLKNNNSGETSAIPAYFTNPAAQIYAGANYQINDQHGVGLVLNTRFYKNRANVGAALSYSLGLFEWLDLALSYAAYNNNYVNIGTGFSVNKGPLQIYMVSDNIVGVFSSRSASNAHINFGVNLVVGRGAGSLAQDNPVADGTEEGEEVEDVQPMEEEIVDDTPSIFKDPATRVDERSFFVKAQIKDGTTGQVINSGVYIDVYRTPVNGGRELVYTTRFPSGSFELELMKSDDMHEMKVEAYGFETTELHFYATGTNLEKEVLLEKAVVNPTPPAVTNANPPANNVQENITSSVEPQANNIEEEVAAPVIDQTPYSVTNPTSFRKEATSQSGVILRFPAGAEVKILEKTDRYWWKVSYKGKEGYVKRSLLEPQG